MKKTVHAYRIEQSEELTKLLLEALEKKYAVKPPRAGAHVAPLAALCLRQSAYRQLYPKPLKPRTMFTFLIGEAAGMALQSLAPYVNGIAEHNVKTHVVQGHIDMFLLDRRQVIEAKSTRSKKNEVNPAYIKQLQYYMAMTGANVGYLFIVRLLEWEPEKGLVTWKLTMEDSELAAVKQELNEKGEKYLAALSNKRPEDLPSVKSTEFEWLCSAYGGCEYRKECPTP